MSAKVIDFRSDTVTKPTSGMRAAMAQAEVGDDVFGEDPTLIALQQRIADLLGKEAAIFVPSGTMSNQIGIRVHCAPGDELICETNCHINNYEQGAHVQLSGVSARAVDGQNGILRLEQLTGLIRADNEHLVHTRLVCLENTHNRASGRIQPYEIVESISHWAHQNGLMMHLDGARLFNAVVATGIDARRWASLFDTVSVCFSKGLGAPVGSALVGPRDLILKARRHRKLFGGGMRQAGVLAAAALYALEHHIDRLADDHALAKRLATILRGIPGITLVSDTIETNIVMFCIDPALGTAAQFCARLKERGLLMLAIGPQQIRAISHLDVNEADAIRAGAILAETVENASHSPSTAGEGVRYA